jgi:glycosyltransferase involved in cell wall biosynthesis
LDQLLDAMRALPDAVLFVVGDGPERPALEARAAAWGTTARLVITGRVPHADMPEYLSAIDIAAVAADRTGVASPMKLLEYMAMARAVVAPRALNILDIAADEGTALLFEPGNVRDLARVLLRLASDPTLRETLGQRARAKVAHERTWRGNAGRVLRLLDAPDPSGHVGRQR